MIKVNRFSISNSFSEKNYLRVLALLYFSLTLLLISDKYFSINHYKLTDSIMLGGSIVFFIFTLNNSIYDRSIDLVNVCYGVIVCIWTLQIIVLNNMSDSFVVMYIATVIVFMASFREIKYIAYYTLLAAGSLIIVSGSLKIPWSHNVVNLISIVMIHLLSLYVNVSRIDSSKSSNKNNVLVNSILETSYDGYIIFDEDFKILKENSTAKLLLGSLYCNGNIREMLMTILKTSSSEVVEFLELEFSNKNIIELINYQNEKKFLVINISKGVIDDYRYYILSLYDNTDIVNNNKTIEYLSNYDTLTLLPNREFIKNILDEFLMNPHNDSTCVLIQIDLDRFKHINDSYGFTVGDIVITKFSNRIKKVVSKRFKNTSSWSLGRSSADEFLLVIYDYQLISKVISVVEDIMRVSKEPYYIYEIKTHVTCSVGLAFYPENGATSDELQKNAALALFNAKKLGGDVYQIYENSIYKDIKGMHIIEEKIKEAMDNNQIIIYYQPIMDVQNEKVFSAEALSRWIDSDNRNIPPDQFIPVLESSGLIKAFDIYVVNEVMKFLDKNKSNDIPPVSINISAVTYSDLKVIQKIEEIIYENKAEKLVKLEITETTAMRDVEYSKFVIGELKKSGIPILLDDFGSGYSSLKYLRDFSFDIVKIDKELIKNVDIDTSVYSVLKACSTMGKELGFKVLAEGVETSAEIEKLKELDFDYIQGYYYSKPVCESNFIEFLKSKRA